MRDESVIKYAYNASFERICLSYWMWKKDIEHLNYLFNPFDERSLLSPKSWRCDMVWAAYNGLPLSLAQVGAVLGLEQQ